MHVMYNTNTILDFVIIYANYMIVVGQADHYLTNYMAIC